MISKKKHINFFRLSFLFLATTMTGFLSHADVTPRSAKQLLDKLPMMKTKSVVSPIDLSEIPPLISVTWIKDEQFLLTCRSTKTLTRSDHAINNNQVHSIEALVFYFLDATTGSLRIIGEEPAYHDTQARQIWRTADFGQTLLLFPYTAPEQFAPLAPVYRWNRPGTWAVQPYRSVNRWFLGDLRFAQIVRHRGSTNLEIRDGRGRVLLQRGLQNQINDVEPLRDCGLALNKDKVWGILGIPDKTSPNFSRLAYYEISQQTASEGSVQMSWFGKKTDKPTQSHALENVGSTDFLSPAIAATKPGVAFFWRHQRLRMSGADKVVDYYECLREEDNNQQRLAWFAVDASAKYATILLPDKTDWQKIISRTGRVPEAGQLPPSPTIACSATGQTVVFSRAYDLFIVQLPN